MALPDIIINSCYTPGSPNDLVGLLEVQAWIDKTLFVATTGNPQTGGVNIALLHSALSSRGLFAMQTAMGGEFTRNNYAPYSQLVSCFANLVATLYQAFPTT
jgi:hypothetical protein